MCTHTSRTLNSLHTFKNIRETYVVTLHSLHMNCWFFFWCVCNSMFEFWSSIRRVRILTHNLIRTAKLCVPKRKVPSLKEPLNVQTALTVVGVAFGESRRRQMVPKNKTKHLIFIKGGGGVGFVGRRKGVIKSHCGSLKYIHSLWGVLVCFQIRLFFPRRSPRTTSIIAVRCEMWSETEKR